jgi:hypothetical protein
MSSSVSFAQLPTEIRQMIYRLVGDPSRTARINKISYQDTRKILSEIEAEVKKIPLLERFIKSLQPGNCCAEFIFSVQSSSTNQEFLREVRTRYAKVSTRSFTFIEEQIQAQKNKPYFYNPEALPFLGPF